MNVHTCNNCQKVFTGKYCSNCGQEAHVGKLDMHSLLHEAWHAFTHTDKGVLKLISDLALRPAITYRDYFAGARKKYFSPVVFFVLSFGLLLLINKWVFDFEDYRYHEMNEFGRYYQQAAKFQALVLLPVQVLVTWLSFLRRYNLAQVIVFWLFCIGFTNVLAIVLSVFRFAFVRHHDIIESVILWIQYLVILIHLFAIGGKGWFNKFRCVLLLFILIAAYMYSAFYTAKEVGVPTNYPTLWQAMKDFFSFN